MSLILLILGLVMFVGLVVVHEFGHFIMARRSGVEVEEFGIFFPPRIWSKKMKSGFTFSINALPLGGFVKLKGEHDADTSKGSFGVASMWSKTKIMFAGIIMNVVTAYILFLILALIGMPQLINNQFTVSSNTKVLKQEVLIAGVESDSPAGKVGLKDQDQLLSITAGSKTTKITNANTLPGITKDYAGKTVELTYKRDGSIITKQTTLRTTNKVNALEKSGKAGGYLGVSPTNYILDRSTWSAPIVAAGLIKQITVLTFKGIGTAIGALFQGNTTKASSQVSGPVGIFELLKDGSLLGYQFILSIVAVISLSLAIINVLPLPALDGGRIFTIYLSRIIKRKAFSQKTEEFVNGAGLLLILLLFVLITIVDIRRFF
jgi:regulator of sigma E protease